MNRNGFVLVIFGGLLGGIGGYFLGNLIIEKIEKRILEEELEEILNQEKENRHISSKDSSKEENTANEKRVSRNYSSYSQREKGELSKLVEPYVSDNKRTGIISTREYLEDSQFQKEEISYYEEDTTYCGMDEEIIDDPNGLFGANVHLHFGEGSDDPDIVYARNEKNGTDYEITRIHNSYSVVVLGTEKGDQKPPKSSRKRNHRKVVNTKNDDELEEVNEEE